MYYTVYLLWLQLQKEKQSSRGVSTDKKCVAVKHWSLVFNCCWLSDYGIQYIYQCLNISIAKEELRYLSTASSRGFSNKTLIGVE